MPATLNRVPFTTSRALEFFSERELRVQTGLSPAEWRLMAVKELCDNSLDACEAAGILPEIAVTLSDELIEVSDNGPGLPRDVLRKQLDFSTRTSTNSKYISPTRGQQGNAAKCILAAPFVVDGAQGRVEVATAEYAMTITVGVDAIRQEPVIDAVDGPSLVKSGTTWRVHWPASSSVIEDHGVGAFLPALGAFNPHLTVTSNAETIVARTQEAFEKWLPTTPTSSLWYSPESLVALISSYLAAQQDRTVRDFVGEFSGLSSTQKRRHVVDAAGLTGSRLSDLVQKGDVDRDAVGRLLEAMQAATTPIRPERLGVIGREHFLCSLERLGGEPETFRYKRIAGFDDDIPYVVEAAFAYAADQDYRRLLTGINWTPTYRDPFTCLGQERESLANRLGDEYCSLEEPIALIVHLATPRPAFNDRGKTSTSLPGPMGEAVLEAVGSVTKAWSKQRHAEEREAQAQRNRQQRLKNRKPVGMELMAAMVQVMPEAYRNYAGQTGIAEARQLMYAARPRLQELTGKQLDDKYFSYQLLPKFQRDYPELTRGWNVVYDQRGTLWEPHTGAKVPLSTLGVRGYLADILDRVPDLCTNTVRLATDIATAGPVGRYQAIIFSEKEGMLPILIKAGIPERYDVALMTTKGNTVTAARELVDELTVTLEALTIRLPIIVLHDFDVTGLTILSTFRKDTDRYAYKTQLQVVDAGLRLGQAQQMRLQDEMVVFPKAKNGKPKTPRRETLQQNTATDDEIEFLLGDGRQGHRIELNAMTSDQFVGLVEDSLQTAGITSKVVPADEQLARSYRQMVSVHRVNQILQDAASKVRDAGSDVAVPKGLTEQVKGLLEKNPRWSWDKALSWIAKEWVTDGGK